MSDIAHIDRLAEIFSFLINHGQAVERYWPFLMVVITLTLYIPVHRFAKNLDGDHRNAVIKLYSLALALFIIASLVSHFTSIPNNISGNANYVYRMKISNLDADFQDITYPDERTYGRSRHQMRKGLRRPLFDEEFVIISSRPLVDGEEFVLRLIEKSPDDAGGEAELRDIRYVWNGINNGAWLKRCADDDGLFLETDCKARQIKKDREARSWSPISAAFAQPAQEPLEYSDALFETETIRDPKSTSSKKVAALKALMNAQSLGDVLSEPYAANYRTLLILMRHSDPEVAYLAEKVLVQAKFHEQINRLANGEDVGAEKRQLLEVIKSATREQLDALIMKSGSPPPGDKVAALPGLGDLAMIPTRTPKGDAYFMRVEAPNDKVLNCVRAEKITLENEGGRHIGITYKRTVHDATRLRRNLLKCGAKLEFSYGY